MAHLYLKYVESTIPVVFHGFLCILAYLFWASFAALTLPMLAIFKLFKLLEKAVIMYRKIGTELAVFDIPFMHESVENPNFMSSLMTMKGKLDIDKLRGTVEDKLVRSQPEASYKRMKQRVVRCYDTYLWKEEESFDIAEHMPVYDEQKVETKSQLETVFSELASRPIPEKLSPWQFTIVPMHGQEEMYAIHFKVHHCIGDGFAMVGLLCQLVDSKPKLVEPKKNQGVMTNPVRRIIKGILTGPLVLLTLMFSRYVRNPFKSKVPPLKKKVSWTNAIELETVKLLKNKTASTVNDVITSCLAGAIRMYLQGEGTVDPEDQAITMTFNSRPVSKKLLDCIPLGNHSGAMFLSLPVSIGDPVKRLEVTKARMDVMKKSADPHLFTFIYYFVLGHLPLSLSRFSCNRLNTHCSLVFSNVPGPVEPIHVSGHVIDSMMITPPLAFDIGVSIAAVTYNGTLRMAIISDERVIKHPEKVTHAFEQILDDFAQRILKLD
eukprot:gene14267-15754_t